MDTPIQPVLWPFKSRVMPVVVISNPDQALPLAHALLEGGIDVMEITLRHAAGLSAIESVARCCPEMHVGAGTVTHAAEVRQVLEAGAKFALSPGLTPELHQAAMDLKLPFMPGVMTPSEIMRARDWGYHTVKLFPAGQAGGVPMLQALAGPLPDIRFCPTGGISPLNLIDHLKLPNVAMVGGSWLTPAPLLQAKDWKAVTALALQASSLSKSI